MVAASNLSKLSLPQASRSPARGSGRTELLNALPVGIAAFRADGSGQAVCFEVNDRLLEWADTRADAFLGLPFARLPLIGEQALLAGHIQIALDGQTVPRGSSSWSVDIGGTESHFSAEVSAFETGGERRALVCIRDRMPELYAETHLRATMMSDSLTGLPNRVSLIDRLEELLAERGGNFGVLIVNIDRFQRINESLGTTVGDEFLIALARRLSGCVRSDDWVARLGADEFAIFLSDCADVAKAEDIVARIHKRLDDPFRLSGGEVYASATIGIAAATKECASAEELLHQADYALRRAKGQGGGGVETYAPRDHSREIGLFHLEADLRRAIERDELELAFQPLIDLETGRMVGVEALSRWNCDGHGAVSPGDFIPIAEESGLIVPLGRAALRNSCARLAEWRRNYAAARRMHVAVNISGVQLRRDDLVAAVAEALSATNLPGSALKIELTESAIVSDPERVRAIFHQLKELGCCISMDDFGTGYSSLAYLQTFPIDVLKIDQSFVRGMQDNEDSQEIIDAILSLSRALKMTTVAEGIETELQMRALKAAGCDIGQGFYFARPLSEEKLIEKLQDFS